MRTVYYDFYSEDFILYIPADFNIVEIGVRKPRAEVISAPKKFVPYIMCYLPNTNRLEPQPHRFKVVSLCPETRLSSEVSIQGGMPVAGAQTDRETAQGGARPMENIQPFVQTSHMRLLGKFSIPNMAELGTSITEDEVRRQNASHLLFMETSNVTVSASSPQGASESTAIVGINENTLMRRF